MHDPASLLLYGRDQSLLHTRKLVLEIGGDNVSITTNASQVRQILNSSSIDLLVLCQTLQVDECDELAQLTRIAWPDTKVLVLEGGRRGCTI